jgi:hypothetical protein
LTDFPPTAATSGHHTDILENLEDKSVTSEAALIQFKVHISLNLFFVFDSLELCMFLKHIFSSFK